MSIRTLLRHFKAVSTHRSILSVFALLAVCLFAAPAARAATPAPVTGTTVGSWTFNQINMAVQVLKDYTGRGHDGSLDPAHPAFRFTNDPVLNREVGVFGTGNGLLLIPASADLSPGAADMAIGVSVKTTDTHNNIIQAGTTQIGHDFIKIEMAGTNTTGLAGVPRCRFIGDVSQDRGGWILLGDKSIADNAWHTIRCDKYANLIVMRVDGVIVNQRSVTVGNIDVSKEIWSIGGKYTPNQTVSPYDMYTGFIKDAYVIINK